MHKVTWEARADNIKSRRVLNLHKAYNIRVGLFVESLVSNPSTRAGKKAGREGGESS